jgi:hypothetical protein
MLNDLMPPTPNTTLDVSLNDLRMQVRFFEYALVRPTTLPIPSNQTEYR